MADKSLGAECALSKLSPEARGMALQSINEVDDLVHALEGLAALTWVVSRQDGLDRPERAALECLSERADSIVVMAELASQKLAAAFGKETRDPVDSPARELIERARRACG